tara:strand:+ start:2051 stop:2707 length:657 start_codon:yes stop_codon:yes gene_type:complete
MKIISIIDYGTGNLKSVFNAFTKVAKRNEKILITKECRDIEKSSHIVLPGVGTFESCINGLKKISVISAINENVFYKKKPFLGICVGMQMLAQYGSENGSFEGLGWIEGNVDILKPRDKSLKIPHIGWNDLLIQKKNYFIEQFERKEKKDSNQFCAYFVHSYNLYIKNRKDLIMSTNYGQEVTAMVAKANIIGTQFHPEKSHSLGLNFIRTFIDWDGN